MCHLHFIAKMLFFTLLGDIYSKQNWIMAESKVDEIKAGGIKGICGIDQLDWGEGKGGKLWECWKCEPCCGQPCNPKDAVYCCLLSYCCGWCVASKAYASSLGQECAIVPHCLMVWCCGWCTATFLRYNLRKKNGVPGNLCGDFMCIWCCGYCAGCQHFRAQQKSDWDFIPGFKFTPKVSGEMKFIN